MFNSWAMSQFIRLLRSLSVSFDIVPRLSRSDTWCFCRQPGSRRRSTSFATGDYVVRDVSHWLAYIICVYEYVDFGGMFSCKLVGIAFGLGCSSLRCVDIGVTLGFVCQFLALLIVSEMCQSRQLAYGVKTIYIHCGVPLMLGWLICSETRQRWSYYFMMSSLLWIDCHDLEKCWIS